MIKLVDTTIQAVRAIQDDANPTDVAIIQFYGQYPWCRVYIGTKRSDIISFLNQHPGFRISNPQAAFILFVAQKTTADEVKTILTKKFPELKFQDARAPSVKVEEISNLKSWSSKYSGD